MTVVLPFFCASQAFSSASPTSPSLSIVDPFGAERARHLGPAWIIEVNAEEARVVEIDLVLLLRTPLLVVEDDRRHWNILTHAGEDLGEAHAPGAIADIGDSRPVGSAATLAPMTGGQRIAAIAEAHCREHRIGLVEAQIGIGDRTDIADIGRYPWRCAGIAFSSSRSIWRGCMWGEPLAILSDQSSFSCAQLSSSFSQASFSALIFFLRSSAVAEAASLRLASR